MCIAVLFFTQVWSSEGLLVPASRGRKNKMFGKEQREEIPPYGARGNTLLIYFWPVTVTTFPKGLQIVSSSWILARKPQSSASNLMTGEGAPHFKSCLELQTSHDTLTAFNYILFSHMCFHPTQKLDSLCMSSCLLRKTNKQTKKKDFKNIFSFLFIQLQCPIFCPPSTDPPIWMSLTFAVFSFVPLRLPPAPLSARPFSSHPFPSSGTCVFVQVLQGTQCGAIKAAASAWAATSLLAKRRASEGQQH